MTGPTTVLDACCRSGHLLPHKVPFGHVCVCVCSRCELSSSCGFITVFGPAPLSQSSSAAVSPQLTKLHQLAMQQSPFPIAPSNQGFTGRKRHEFSSLHSTYINTSSSYIQHCCAENFTFIRN